MLLRGRHYRTQQLVDVAVDRGVIMSIGSAGSKPADVQAGWIAPSLFDLQINGCDGHGFNSPTLTRDQIRHVTDVCRKHGVGELCPTLVTGSFEALAHGFTTLRRACEEERDLGKALPCFHLEGPYISPEDGPRGAHPRAHVRPPSWDEFQRWQDAAGGRIKLVTLAPESEGAIPFIEKLVRDDIVVSLGHTNAKRHDIQAAVKAGARLSTHLGNGSHAVLPRHDNYLWEQLAEDGLWASIICDGHHLPPTVVKCITRMKTPARLVLTCDAGTLAGSPPGLYKQWDQDFEVLPIGKIVVPGTAYLAGSWAFTDDCVGKAIAYADVTLAEAIDMASAQPRRLLGLPTRTLDVGQPANLVLFDWQPGGAMEVKRTLVEGK